MWARQCTGASQSPRGCGQLPAVARSRTFRGGAHRAGRRSGHCQSCARRGHFETANGRVIRVLGIDSCEASIDAGPQATLAAAGMLMGGIITLTRVPGVTRTSMAGSCVTCSGRRRLRPGDGRQGPHGGLRRPQRCESGLRRRAPRRRRERPHLRSARPAATVARRRPAGTGLLRQRPGHPSPHRQQRALMPARERDGDNDGYCEESGGSHSTSSAACILILTVTGMAEPSRNATPGSRAGCGIPTTSPRATTRRPPGAELREVGRQLL